MIPDNVWNIIAKKAFPDSSVKAPPFLWTRVLVAIETQEALLASRWWVQWRWMSRITVAMGLIVTLGAFYLVQHDALPFDAALDGRSDQQQALQLASSEVPGSPEAIAEALVLDS